MSDTNVTRRRRLIFCVIFIFIIAISLFLVWFFLFRKTESPGSCGGINQMANPTLGCCSGLTKASNGRCAVPTTYCIRENQMYSPTVECCNGLIKGSNNRCIVPPTGNPRYKIVDGMNLTGKDILTSIGPQGKFNYFIGADQTHGYVTYGAYSDLLQVVDSTKLRINIGTNKGQPRYSIRLVSNNTFDSGLLVFDVEHVPADLSSWPAFWTTGDVNPPSAWALSGEIDIFEQVNNSNTNAVTLHTNTPPGLTPCKMDPSLGFGNLSDCNATGGSTDKTCGFQSQDYCPYRGCSKQMGPNTFGSAFNANGGGTFAMELTPDGRVTVWFWKRGEIVPDFATVTDSNFTVSDPRNVVKFSACPNQFLKQRIVINTTLCGDWAGNVAGSCNGYNIWTNNNGCINFVNNNDLKESYWIIRSLQLYTINSANK